MTVFQQRAVTAAVFGVVMLVGVFGHVFMFKTLFGCITAGCLWEFISLTLKGEEYLLLRKILGVALGISPFVMVSFGMFGAGNDVRILNFIIYVSISAGFLIAYSTLVMELFLKAEKPFYNIGVMMLSILYIGIPFSLLMHMCYLWGSFNPNIPAGILFLTWMNDTGAYIVGSQVGKTPFFPRHSPKKTWEGTAGGAVFCVILGYVLSWYFKELSHFDWIAVALIVAVFGSLGDLVESMLKRSVGVKDSGRIMPGHGGFLDRFDAFVFCIPFVFFYLMLRGPINFWGYWS